MGGGGGGGPQSRTVRFSVPMFSSSQTGTSLQAQAQGPQSRTVRASISLALDSLALGTLRFSVPQPSAALPCSGSRGADRLPFKAMHSRQGVPVQGKGSLARGPWSLPCSGSRLLPFIAYSIGSRPLPFIAYSIGSRLLPVIAYSIWAAACCLRTVRALRGQDGYVRVGAPTRLQSGAWPRSAPGLASWLVAMGLTKRENRSKRELRRMRAGTRQDSKLPSPGPSV